MRAHPTLTIGSLFSGIGGLELGLERAGLGPVLWQCEIDPFCRAVLAKHWPNVTRFEDVTTKRDWPHVDLICGGFPCQDVSSAGKRRGLGGERSGLWYHFARIISEIRPRYVVVENVASGARMWLPSVRHHLHGLGYRTRALGIAASDVGALHQRKRIFVVAHADADHGVQHAVSEYEKVASSPTIADPDDNQSNERKSKAQAADVWKESRRSSVRTRGPSASWAGGGFAQPDVVRVVHGLPRGLDRRRIRGLGNAVVPQCAEVVGRVLLESITAHVERTGDSR